MNLYEYAGSNPVDTLDPRGLSLSKSIITSIVREVFKYCTDYKGGEKVIGVILAGIRASHPRCLPGSLTALTAGNPYAHCVWSCKVAKTSGKGWAEKCGKLKEGLDRAVADFADSIRDSCWNHLPVWIKGQLAAWACSADQESDLRDNAAGRLCGTDECLKCEYPKCGDCCADYHGIKPDTPEGEESKGERPYGPRCTDRYKRALGEPESTRRPLTFAIE